MEAARPEELRATDLPVVFGRYTLESVLGEGGMARVFGATLRGPAGFTKEVALKVVRDSAMDDTARALLISEARIGGLLNHPHVVNTLDLGEIDDTLIIAMELVVGVSVHRMLRRLGPLSPAAACDIAIQSCLGLEHAHGLAAGGRALQLVHRDLKPGNLMVSHDGTVKVCDFGIALAHGIADGREVMGTPPYMSPEQIRGESLGPRSDLFAMGAVIAAMALGASPFQRHSSAAAVRAIQEAPQTLADLGTLAELDGLAPGLGKVVGRCLRLDPAERWSSAEELGSALGEVAARLEGGPSLAELVARCTGSTLDVPTPSQAAATTIRLLDATNVMPADDLFVGREAELAGIRERFELGRLVTVTGPGGTGKSRLVQQWVASNVGRYQDAGGAWLVDLGEARDLRDLLVAVVQVLDLNLDADDPAVLCTSIGDALARRGRMLLAFDPFEALVDEAEAAIGTWLKRARELHVLVASRERLRVPSEAVLVLEPLPTDDAVALFFARVAEKAPQLGADDTLRERVHTLVERLEGVPLALELAAAQLPQTTLSRLLRRRSDSALRSALEDSWALLSAPERHALAQLSVFADGFTIHDAEAVVDLSDHLDAPWVVFVVEALVDKSLVRAVPVPELRGRHRFGLYESIRRFAAEQIRRPDGIVTAEGVDCSGPVVVQQVEQRFVERFVRRAGGIEMDGLDARRIERRWLRLSLDLGNLQAAMSRAMTMQRSEDAARIGLAAARVLERQGSLVAGLEVVQRLTSVSVEPALRVPLLLEQARLLRARGRLDEARVVLDAAPGSRAGADMALDVATLRAGIAVDEGAHGSAVQLLDSALGRCGDDAAVVRVCMARVVLARALLTVDVVRASAVLDEVGAALEQAGSVVVEAEHQAVRAMVLHERGDPHEASAAADAALIVSRRLGDPIRVARAHLRIGVMLASRGDTADAIAALERAHRDAGRAGDRAGEGRASRHLADLAVDQGDLQGARARYREALTLLGDRGHRLDEACVVARLGELDALMGERLEAGTQLDRAVRQLRGLDARAALSSVLGVRAVFKAEEGDPDGAEDDMAAALRLAGAVGSARLVAELALRRGFVFEAAGLQGVALDELLTARRLLRELGAGPSSKLTLLADDLAHAVGAS